MDISIILPCYNEEENLKILLPRLHKIVSALDVRYELIAVDSKDSCDNSESICINNNSVYIRQTKTGYADAFRTGIEKAKYDLIIIVDADNSQDIGKIPEMYGSIINGADVVIGSRYIKGGTTEDPLISVLMSRLLNFTYRIFLGFKEKDVSTDFRIYKKYMLKNIKTESDNFDVIEETLFKLKEKYHPLKIVEVPINYKQREKGVSKRKLFKFICGYIRLLFKLIKRKF